ncbi:hypothetical protein GCK72_023592 [Caenorhabditis remanei]|uniref:Uncharacterized protein n=1 Tax=Caenorhabditis remanei TaxID=31234 RepID=A0A6A5FX77_CAERE|nr:hypothetical protein GCK72_023592 [Caenorhabditis remanei]KAF1747132.1 hypothetical protein GCK72_023592 [Caenorhabditis remanei]
MTVILYYSIAGNIEDTAHNGWCLISNTYNGGSNVVMSGFGNGKTERNVLQKKHKEWEWRVLALTEEDAQVHVIHIQCRIRRTMS